MPRLRRQDELCPALRCAPELSDSSVSLIPVESRVRRRVIHRSREPCQAACHSSHSRAVSGGAPPPPPCREGLEPTRLEGGGVPPRAVGCRSVPPRALGCGSMAPRALGCGAGLAPRALGLRALGSAPFLPAACACACSLTAGCRSSVAAASAAAPDRPEIACPEAPGMKAPPGLPLALPPAAAPAAGGRVRALAEPPPDALPLGPRAEVGGFAPGRWLPLGADAPLASTSTAAVAGTAPARGVRASKSTAPVRAERKSNSTASSSAPPPRVATSTLSPLKGFCSPELNGCAADDGMKALCFGGASELAAAADAALSPDRSWSLRLGPSSLAAAAASTDPSGLSAREPHAPMPLSMLSLRPPAPAPRAPAPRAPAPPAAAAVVAAVAAAVAVAAAAASCGLSSAHTLACSQARKLLCVHAHRSGHTLANEL